MDGLHLHVDLDSVAVIAREWNIQELALFGSVVGDDFREDSDIDVLVQFAPEAHYSLFDLVDLKSCLERLFLRPVDLIEKGALRNPFRKKHILETAKVIYAA